MALKAIFPAAAVTAVKLGTPGVGADFGVIAALLAEIIMTFFLMYSVFGSQSICAARGPLPGW